MCFQVLYERRNSALEQFICHLFQWFSCGCVVVGSWLWFCFLPFSCIVFEVLFLWFSCGSFFGYHAVQSRGCIAVLLLIMVGLRFCGAMCPLEVAFVVMFLTECYRIAECD